MKHHTYRLIGLDGLVIASFVCDESESDAIYNLLVKLQCSGGYFRFTRASGILTNK